MRRDGVDEVVGAVLCVDDDERRASGVVPDDVVELLQSCNH